MPDLYDGWEDDVQKAINYWFVGKAETYEGLAEGMERLRAAFIPHVHDWRWVHIYANGSEADVVCVGCSRKVHIKGLSTAHAALPKYDGPDPLGGEK